MSIFKCKMCGGTLEVSENQTTAVCEYCSTRQTLPKLDNDQRAQMYDRANHFRRNNEFDKAMSIYEKILNEDNTDAETYWSLVLCRYGIEYVEDPKSRKRVPTVNRTQFTSIFDDADYKSALQYADGYQRHLYEEEARTISEIQKGILAISQKEEPFDVFICYKETDSNNKRTEDSVLANDLYHQLTNEGFKVFFSRITLEDKLGTAYEPYIFAALNSAKVMVVLGTKPEYFNAAWVKNEWSRYLALVRQSAGKKILIPAYKDMDPYDLPEEFSHLQAQDISKLGFMQDLIRGIKKLTADTPAAPVPKETVVINSNDNAAPLLRRAFMFLEDSDWASANNYCEKVLDLQPENAEAYLGKLMAELKVHNRESLKAERQAFDNNSNYQKAIRFADPTLKTELQEYNNAVKYHLATERFETATTASSYKEAANLFKKISAYRDADQKAQECLEKVAIITYNHAIGVFQMAITEKEFKKAANLFKEIPAYRDADQKAQECLEKAANIIYNHAMDVFQMATTEKEFKKAANLFKEIPTYKDAKQKAQECLEKAKDAAPKDNIYNTAQSLLEQGKIQKDETYTSQQLEMKRKSLESALNKFGTISGWRDADKKATSCRTQLENITLEIQERIAIKKRNNKIKMVVIPIVAILITLLVIFKWQTIIEIVRIIASIAFILIMFLIVNGLKRS